MGISASSAAAVRAWTADDVAVCVARFGTPFSKYAEVAKENGLDGSTLLILNPDTLKEQVQELMGAEAKSFHVARLSAELCKLKEHAQRASTQANQAKEEKELNQVSGPMVEWLVSIFVEERMARKYAAEMKKQDFHYPSDLVGLSEDYLMEYFGIKKGSTMKMCQALNNPASLPPKTPAGASPNGTAGTEQLNILWQWCNNDGNYISYDNGANLQIEEAWKQKRVTVSITSGGKEYVIDLVSMRQKLLLNVDVSAVTNRRRGAGRTRNIRRWTKEENHPPTWDYMPPGEDYKVVNVKRGTADWVRAEQTMFARDGFSRTTRELLKVERIQNRTLLKRYRMERDIIMSRRGAANLNELYLFHGTSKTEPLKIATSPDGFVIAAGRSNTLYGQGGYLAEKARYSHHYAHKLLSVDKKQRHRQLLLVSVVCGVSKEYKNNAIDRNMSVIALSQQGFDSVLGGPHRPRHSGPGEDDSRMYVVYKSSQLMPEFLLTYKADEDNTDCGGGGGASVAVATSVTTSATTSATSKVERTIHVKNIGFGCNDEMFLGVVQSFGAVTNYKVCGDGKAPVRFAFVEYSSTTEAKLALEGLPQVNLGASANLAACKSRVAILTRPGAGVAGS